MRRDALPVEWIDRVFQKLSVRYGRSFMARWDGIDEALVKADWAEHLAGFARRPDCLAYALENLPADRPPTVAQFREIANSKPEEHDLPLIDHKRGPIPANVLQALDKLKEPADVAGQYRGNRAWAYRLRDREAAGERLKPISARYWREALRHDTLNTKEA